MAQEKPLSRNLPAKGPAKYKADIMPSEKLTLSIKRQKQLNHDLRNAAMENIETNMLRLINEGADMTAKDSDGAPALYWVVSNGNTEICALMLQKCAKDRNRIKGLLTETNKGGWTLLQTLLHRAAYDGYTGICALLMEEYAKISGNDINKVKEFITKKDKDGNTALQLAKNNRHIQTALFLAEVLARAFIGKESGELFVSSFKECISGGV
jgi:ankyrin repeat protein